MDKVTLSQVFAEAADYIDDKGWMHSAEGQHGGPRCGIGAVRSVLKERGLDTGSSADRVNSVFMEITTVPIPTYNDSYSSNEKDVPHLFRKISLLLSLEARRDDAWMNNIGMALAAAAGHSEQAERDGWMLRIGLALFNVASYAQYNVDFESMVDEAQALKKLSDLQKLIPTPVTL